MANLKRAFQQLFSRPEDERFSTLEDLYSHCYDRQQESTVHWKCPAEVIPTNIYGELGLKLTGDQRSGFIKTFKPILVSHRVTTACADM